MERPSRFLSKETCQMFHIWMNRISRLCIGDTATHGDVTLFRRANNKLFVTVNGHTQCFGGGGSRYSGAARTAANYLDQIGRRENQCTR